MAVILSVETSSGDCHAGWCAMFKRCCVSASSVRLSSLAHMELAFRLVFLLCKVHFAGPTVQYCALVSDIFDTNCDANLPRAVIDHYLTA